MPAVHASSDGLPGSGLLFGVGAYLLWGMLPLYFAALAPAGAWEILAVRVLFALLLCLVCLALFGQMRRFLQAFARPRVLLIFAAAGILIGCNWLIYIIATTSGHTVEASLGYFINPMVSVLLGVVVLGERLRRLQWAALGLGTIAVVVLGVFYGAVPWLSLGLAFSFGAYGLVKKQLGRSWPALVSLTMETVALLPVSVALLVWLQRSGQLTLLGHGAGHSALLVAAGPVTVVPLLLFGLAAARLPLSLVGMLQYLAPVMQFLIAVVVFSEPMPLERWAGFCLVWGAIVLLLIDAAGTRRRRRRAALP